MIECESRGRSSTVESTAQCAHRVGGDGMTLEFGVFDHLDRNDLPLRDYYEQRLKVIEAFDRSGFYAYHVAEHHFTPLGMAPSPSVFLSAIGQRTTATALRHLRLCAAGSSPVTCARGNLHARSHERRPA